MNIGQIRAEGISGESLGGNQVYVISEDQSYFLSMSRNTYIELTCINIYLRVLVHGMYDGSFEVI